MRKIGKIRNPGGVHEYYEKDGRLFARSNGAEKERLGLLVSAEDVREEDLKSNGGSVIYLQIEGEDIFYDCEA